MPSKRSIGEAFRLARKAAGLSQDDFMACSSRTFVSSIERGLKSPTVEKLSQLCQFMGTEPAVIVLVATQLDQIIEDKKPVIPLADIDAVAAALIDRHKAHAD